MTRGETPSLLGKYGVRKGEGEGNKMRRRGMEEKYTQQACVYVDCKCFRDYSIVFLRSATIAEKRHLADGALTSYNWLWFVGSVVHARMHACMHARMHACTHACMWACVWVHAYVYGEASHYTTHARTHARTHTDTHKYCSLCHVIMVTWQKPPSTAWGLTKTSVSCYRAAVPRSRLVAS